MDDPYEVLGVQPGASEVVITAAYKALVKEHHPDQGGDQTEFTRIQKAYEAIQNGPGTETQYSSDPYFSNLGKKIFGGIAPPVNTATAVGAVSSNLVIDEGPLTITLIALFRTDITDLVWEQYRDETQTENRFVAIFHIENTSEFVQSWDGCKETVFIGTDSHTYEARQLDLAAQEYTPLPPQFDTNFAEMQPHTITYGVLVPAEVPSGVDIERIVYTHKVFEGDKTSGWAEEMLRYEFQIEPEDRLTMRKYIAGELDAPAADPTEASPERPNESPTTEPARETRSGSGDSLAQGLTVRDLARLQDVVDLQPTSNSQLQKQWGLANGKEVHIYLKATLSEYIYRNEDRKICVTDEAVDLVTH